MSVTDDEPLQDEKRGLVEEKALAQEERTDLV